MNILVLNMKLTLFIIFYFFFHYYYIDDTRYKMGIINDDHPLTDLVAANVLNLIAIHGNLNSGDDFDKIKPDTRLEQIGIDNDIKKKVFHEFEKSLGTIYVGDEKYVFNIQTPLESINTVSDIISAILNPMQEIVRQVSE